MPGLETSQISPELALVCPELAERARAALPERPWEAWLPARPAIADRDAQPHPRQPGQDLAERHRGPSRAEALAGRLLAAVLLGLVLAVAGALGASEIRPPAATLVEPAPDEPLNGVSTAPPTVVPERVAVYVFGDGGRFTVSEDGAAIVDLSVPLACRRVVELEAIPIGEHGMFSGRETQGSGAARLTIEVEGRVDGTREASLELVVAGASCSERISAVARPS